MENLIMQILNSNEAGLLKVVFLLIVFLIFLVKQRKTVEKLNLIEENHLHSINETLERIEFKIENGFKSLDDKVAEIQKSVEIVKDRQKRR